MNFDKESKSDFLGGGGGGGGVFRARVQNERVSGEGRVIILMNDTLCITLIL